MATFDEMVRPLRDDHKRLTDEVGRLTLEVEDLKRRLPPQPPARTDIGVNLEPVQDWSTDRPFVNAALLLRRPENPAGGRYTGPINSQGYPAGDFRTSADLTAYPDGVYRLSWLGKATVAVAGKGRVKGAVGPNA